MSTPSTYLEPVLSFGSDCGLEIVAAPFKYEREELALSLPTARTYAQDGLSVPRFRHIKK